uniref:NET domain-containing protein n=1 Tax=viral metagenome TaxID=1070528 RepID=A0A6C0KTU7_9ZZZZ
MDINELNTIRDKIELMPKFNQVEVLRILSKHSIVTLNENKYGVHINLTDLSENIIEELKIYIKYVNTQELNLNEMEKQKEEFKNTFFGKDNKDNQTKISKNAAITA